MIDRGEPAPLPAVLHTAPAAVVIIDQGRRQVVYANPAAMSLTSEPVGLPVDVDRWSDAAGLADLGGTPLSATASPLSLVASGLPVAGEPVTAGAGILLWVTGFPLSGMPQPQAIVVFLQLSGTEHGERRLLEVLRDRAVVATETSFTITDPRRDENPLVWVNPAFTRQTGYAAADVVGHNCRFLQGRGTDPAAVARIREALHARRPITEVLLNYRRDGTAFWNQLSISPVLDGAGELVNFVGVQNDVTERVMVEQERRAALAEAEEARAQLRLLAEATTEMTTALDVVDVCARLTRVVVPSLADLCAVDLLDHVGGGTSRRVAVAARDSSDEDLMRRLAQVRRYGPRQPGEIGAVLGGGPPALISDLPERGIERFPDDAAAAALYDRLRLRSAVIVPLRARGHVLGVLTLYTQHPYGRRYAQRDLHVAADLAGRAGLAVDNARLYENEHAAAAMLQRSLLPEVPRVAGLSIAARYLVGVDGNQVGGDWYDVLALPDGAVGVAVGDVVGHDLRAAAAMGQLRGVLRSYAWDGGSAGSVIDRCDRLVQGLEMAAMATAVYARIEPAAGAAGHVIRYANAGHPAPLLLAPDGRLARLDEHRSPMIGAVRRGRRHGPPEAVVACPPGSLLLLYTDGFTDVAGEDADERTRMLEETLAATSPGADVEAVADAVLSACAPREMRDDVALLVVRLDGR